MATKKRSKSFFELTEEEKVSLLEKDRVSPDTLAISAISAVETDPQDAYVASEENKSQKRSFLRVSNVLFFDGSSSDQSLEDLERQLRAERASRKHKTTNEKGSKSLKHTIDRPISIRIEDGTELIIYREEEEDYISRKKRKQQEGRKNLLSSDTFDVDLDVVDRSKATNMMSVRSLRKKNGTSNKKEIQSLESPSKTNVKPLTLEQFMGSNGGPFLQQPPQQVFSVHQLFKESEQNEPPKSTLLSIQKYLDVMTVPELRSALRSAGLPAVGKKQDLLDRIRIAIKEEG